MKKIQDNNPYYNLFHYYVNAVIKQSYRKFLYVGKENIPQDGAVIFAINHTNALMDALVLLAIDHKPKVFVARADIFKIRPLAKFFTFLKIMPIMRLRDGIDQVKKNQETIDKAVDVLKDKIPFCIFPEGTHQAKYSSLPLSKGIFRIAFQAQELMPNMPLYIVPVGLTYGSFFRFRSTIRVQIGQPINVSKFIADRSELSQPEQMNAMKDVLTERLHANTFYIPNNDEYNATFEVCNAAQPFEMEALRQTSGKKQHSLNIQFQANNNITQRVAALKESNPEQANKLLQLGQEAHALRMKRAISRESAAVKRPLVSRIGRLLLLLFTLPYTIPASLLASPIALLCKYLFTILKDPAFRNSVRFLMQLFVWPLLLVIYAIIAFCVLPWQVALPAILLAMPAPIVAHEVWKTIRLTISDIKLLREKKLCKLYAKIREIILD
ncbi:MAG: 1-acyl-sn-glycerol-3-phosphate acyltransferase [Bacteroides sp.]|nr:1-acyl-sn-glycerol-3-phosphate acyltransferase [Bacteroides sp.]